MKLMKKSISVVLALLMVFSSFSMLTVFAADTGIYNWETNTKFFRMQRNADGFIVDADGNVIGDADDNLADGSTPVWVETTKAMKGEKVRARIYIKADGFALANFSLLHVYPTSVLTADESGYTATTGGYKAEINTEDAEFANLGLEGVTKSGVGVTGKLKETITYNINGLDSADYEHLSWTFAAFGVCTSGAFNTDGSKWIYELHFTVNEDADDLGQCYVLPESISDYDNFEVPTYVCAQENAGDGWNTGLPTLDDYDGLFNYPTLSDRDADSTINYQTTLNFDAGDGAFADGSTTASLTADVDPFTAAAVEEPTRSGFLFTGWTATYAATGEAVSDDLIATADIKVGYNDINYVANYESAGKTATVVVNYTDAITGEPATATKEYGTSVGNTVKIVESKPEVEEENVTYILYKELPVVQHYEFDAANASNELTLEITADGETNLNVYYVPVKYTATFDPANGEEVTEYTEDYYTTITAPAAPTASEGKEFTGWKLDDTTTIQPADTFKLEGNVTYTAQYKDTDYAVEYVYAGDVPEGAKAPEATTANKGATITLTDPEAVDGYTFKGWTVEGADYDAETKTVTVGTTAVKITGTWEINSYTYKYYLDDEKEVLFATKDYEYGAVPEAVDVPTDEELAEKGFPGWTAIEWDTDLPETVTGSLDIVLTKEQIAYWVEFVNKDGEALELEDGEDGLEAYYGDTIETSIVKGDADVEGYTATGKWHIGDEDGEIATFPYTVKGDVTFVADYEINKHNIIYYADEEGKTELKKFELEYAQEFTEEHVVASASKEGYVFKGWSEEITVGDTMPDYDIKIYPSFDPDTFTITWVIDGVESTDEQTFGEDIKAPENPTKEGYTFKGWSTTENGAVLETLGTVPANDNTKFYAVFAGDSDVAYTVNKIFMNTDGTYDGVEAVSETLYGTAGSKVTYTPADPEGFTFDAAQANVLEGTIAGDGSLKLTVYYSRNKVNVTIGDVTEEYYYGEEIETPETPDGDDGYTFDKWVDENGDEVKFPVTVGTEDIVIKPTFEPNTDTAYIINIYVMGLDGEYGTPETETRTGTTDTQVTYTPEDKLGFTPDKESYTVTIKADESDTINVYYARQKYDVIYIADGKEVDRIEDVYFGARLTGSENYTAPAGYNLLGWSAYKDATTPDSFLGYMGIGDVKIYAVLEAATDTAYTVEIYEMNIDGNYDDVEPQVLTFTGTTDTEATYTAAPSTGFYLDEDNSTEGLKTTITADDSDVIKVYYARTKVSVTIGDDTTEMYYGEEITEPAETPDSPTEGKEFDKWVDEDGNEVEFPVTVGTEDIVIKPEFKPIQYTVTFIVEGMEDAYATGKFDFGSVIVKPDDDPAKTGYTFKGWAKTAGGDVVDDLGTVPVDGITFYAVFEGNDNISYTVKKFYMNTTGDGWLEPVDDVRTGTAGETVTIDFANEATEGFTIDETNSTKSAVISGNGDTVLVIYYNRNKVSVTINGVTEDKYYEEEIETPETPKAEDGYTFNQWVDEDGNEVKFPITVGTEDIVINPTWTKLSYSVTFKAEDGTILSGPTTYEYGAAITAPEVEDRDGYTFVGWIAEGTGARFDGTVPATDVVYVETWNSGDVVQYKIETYIMDMNGDYQLQTWAYGSATTGSIQYLTAEAIPGFTVDTENSVLSAAIAGDNSTVLKAYYARDMYKVTFDGANEKELYYGAAIPEVEPAAQTGKTFTGWVVEGTGEAAPATMPANDLVLVSTWTDTVYTITYVVNGKQTKVEYTYGADVATPDDPEVSGMKFTGWQPSVPKTMPAEDLIIVATFENAIYKVTFLDYDGGVFAEQQVRSGGAIVLPAGVPTKKYYTFVKWVDVPAAMPAEDIVIKPEFERVPVELIPMAGSTTVIDRDNMVIYGLEVYLDEDLLRSTYLDVEGDGYFTVTPVANGCYGTGTVIELYDNVTGELLETYHIVIFGDVNGDARITSVDAAMASDESLMLTTWSYKEIYENGQLVENANYCVYRAMAADVNGKNGNINASDVNDIGDASLGAVVIDQVTGTVNR